VFHRQSLELQLIMLAAVEVQLLQQAAQVVMVAEAQVARQLARQVQPTQAVAVVVLQALAQQAVQA
jgi:hypothetical protein